MRASCSRSSSRAAREGALVALAGVAALLSGGCASSTLSVRVEAKPDANGGAPFYMVVRAVEQATFVTESYEAVAAKVFVTPADPTLLKAEVVYPGTSMSVTIERPKDAAAGIGVYFLYTKPGERWKTARNAPLPEAIDVVLGGSQIDEEE